jgi:enoyl-CoA hydratase/carnithine racemase
MAQPADQNTTVEIILSGPGKNALGTALMAKVREELTRAGGQPVLLRGEGDAFSAGLNLKEVSGLDPDGMRRFLGLLEDLVLDLYNYPGPVVASINGHAIAGGCVLALACDLRIAAENPKLRIGLNEVALGVRYPPRVMALVRDRVPRRALERVVLGAELHPPERARALGLVDEISAEPESVARARLAELARHPADAYQAAKRALREDVLRPTREAAARFENDDLPVWTSERVKAQIRAMLGSK